MKPIFMESWWMDAVCAGKHWEEILPDMPCLVRKRWWMRWISMPQQTQIGGMWVDVDAVTVQQVREQAKEIDAKLREMKLDYYYQQFPVGSPLPEELSKLRYKVKERVTYRLEDLSDLEKVVGNFSKNKKRNLGAAQVLRAKLDMSAEDFYRFHTACMTERKRRISYSREFLLVLDRKLQREQKGQILSICNEQGIVYAAAYLVWDSEYMYYLIPCFSVAHKESGASSLLVLEAIKLAKEKGLKFDFEGSMIRGVANHYKQFGAEPVVYYSVEKIFRWPFVFALFFNWLRNLKYRG